SRRKRTRKSLEPACPHAVKSTNEKRPPEFRCARSEDKRPAYLGKRASRSFLALGSTSETLAVQDNRDGCLPILVNSSALNPRSSSTPLLHSMNFERGSIARWRFPVLLIHRDGDRSVAFRYTTD